MSILESYNKTKQFNTLCGSLAKADVVLQLKLMLEELEETAIAVKHMIEEDQNNAIRIRPYGSIQDDWDLVELIDGAVDMKVISDGLLQILEAKGFDVSKALLRVGDNNLSKFPTIEPNMADYDSRWTKTYNEKFGVWVLKDENGKVRKPHDYVPVDLSDCIPKQQ